MSFFVDLLISSGDEAGITYAMEICNSLDRDTELDALVKGRALTHANTFVKPFSTFGLARPIGAILPNQICSNYLDQARVRIGDNDRLLSATSANARPFIDVLKKLGAIIDGEVGERDYRPGRKDPSFDNIATKFVDDHLVNSKKEAEIHARNRLSQNANVPASTSLLRSYAANLDKEMGELNESGAFSAITEFIETVASHLLGTDEVESICYVSNSKFDGYNFTRSASGGKPNGGPVKGHLAYCVVPNEAQPEHKLAYHFQDVLPNKTDLPRAKAGHAWKLITLQDFQKKVPKSRIQIHSKDWPVVYYLG